VRCRTHKIPKNASAAGDIKFPRSDLWVFAYGSLMWNPGFPYKEAQHARIYGYHRALCVWSWVYRGTPRVPGLVLGLDCGGSCVGRAFRVARNYREHAVRYLIEREMITDVYRPRLCPLRLADNRRVTGLTFQVDRDHDQYAGKLSAERAATAVSGATGCNGSNIEYVTNTVDHLAEMGFRDPVLWRVRKLLAEK